MKRSFAAAAARTMAALLLEATVLGGGASIATGGQAISGPSLGSADEYVKGTPNLGNAYEVPLLGIEVNNAADRLKNGRTVSGVEVLTAVPSGAGAAAGLQGRHQGMQTALTVGILAGAVFFPPAMLGMMALQQSGIGASHELIIAVDGQRTRDVSDFGDAIAKAEGGEIVYLTVVSGGRREQIPVELPVGRIKIAGRPIATAPHNQLPSSDRPISASRKREQIP